MYNIRVENEVPDYYQQFRGKHSERFREQNVFFYYY